MKTTVVSREYKELQSKIIKLQESWKNSVHADGVNPNLDKAAMAAGVPVVALADIHFEIPLFLQWIKELEELLVNQNPALSASFEILNDKLTETVAHQWIEEALSFNQSYFNEFARETGLEEWLPYFLAESAVRPYLQILAEKAQPEIHKAEPRCGCQVCGEPVRIAQLEGEGQKVVYCPRCTVHWRDKRVACSHCGNNDHKTVENMNVEGEAAAQIQVCEKCHGYTKVIDTRQYITKPTVAILDLTTIHLDFIAQERGYTSGGSPKGKN
ncbi:formate dehydrogenase accessory protein FdhE [Mesobacillus harenae]|uniref:formate dehydrogenase accessory protein FdhE n=1 Tax=Mesobacillus harenae TaxID=2213203 RepID=UPI001580AA15|nr:formate dehydrogenase accessory protein FdhE [Mesobacillus harenae]